MILVTGAHGFVGKYLLERLRELGHLAIPLQHAEKARALGDRWECDLTRPDHLITLQATAPVPEVIVHLAGYIEIALQANPQAPDAPPIPAQEDVSKIYSINVGGTANLLDYSLRAGVRRLIFASSQAVYGMPQTFPLTEETPCAPLEHYAMSKLCCEQLLRTGARQGLDITVLRVPGIFSETRQSGVVFQFCRQAIQTKQIRVRAGFPLPLDVLHLEDAVDGIEKAVRHGGANWSCLNLAYNEPCSLDLLADAIAELVPGCQVEHSQVPQPVVQLDARRAYAMLGWTAKSRCLRLASMLENIRHAG